MDTVCTCATAPPRIRRTFYEIDDHFERVVMKIFRSIHVMAIKTTRRRCRPMGALVVFQALVSLLALGAELDFDALEDFALEDFPPTQGFSNVPPGTTHTPAFSGSD